MNNLDEVTKIPPVYKIMSTRIMIIANSKIVVMSQEIISADLTNPIVRIKVMFPDSFIHIRCRTDDATWTMRAKKKDIWTAWAR